MVGPAAVSNGQVRIVDASGAMGALPLFGEPPKEAKSVAIKTYQKKYMYFF